MAMKSRKLPCKLKKLRASFCLAFTLLGVHGVQAKDSDESFHLKVHLNIGGLDQEIKHWPITEILHLKGVKKVKSFERDPVSGKIIPWEGVLISELIEDGMTGLLSDKRAQVDLVVLKSDINQALIPRAFISKYPMLLGFKKSPKSTQQEEDLYSIVPWSSKPKVLEEDLPLESYFLSHVQSIQLTSYRDQYSNLFLKRRTDPAAMRGEKLFVQSCVSCHSQVNSGSISRIFNGNGSYLPRPIGHPTGVKMISKLKERDWRSIGKYLEAYRSEGSGEGRQPTHSVQMHPDTERL